MKAKLFTTVVVLSLSANLALSAVWLWRTAHAAPTVTFSHAAPSAKAAPLPAAVNHAETWTELNAPTDADLVGRLRAEGFPPDMIHALIDVRLRARYAAELRKFRPTVDYAYWRGNFYSDDLSPEARAERRALERKIADERRLLMGADSDLATDFERASRARAFGSIPAAKVEQLSAILKDYSDIAAGVRDRAKGVTFPEDREQLALLEREKRADLVKLLTPEELADYDLRSSPSAAIVRNRLRFFNPSEDEYRAITAAQLAFDERYGVTNLLSAEQQQRRTEAEVELNAQIKNLLPSERLTEYAITTDPFYSRIDALVQEAHLPATATAHVVTAQRDFAQRGTAIKENRNLTSADRESQLSALAQEATIRLTTLLGPHAFATYKQNGGPLNSLLNRPPAKR